MHAPDCLPCHGRTEQDGFCRTSDFGTMLTVSKNAFKGNVLVYIAYYYMLQGFGTYANERHRPIICCIILFPFLKKSGPVANNYLTQCLEQVAHCRLRLGYEQFQKYILLTSLHSGHRANTLCVFRLFPFWTNCNFTHGYLTPAPSLRRTRASHDSQYP